MGQRSYGVDVNGGEIPDYRAKPGVGVDVKEGGINDHRTGTKIMLGQGLGMAREGYGYGGYRY